MQPDSIPQSRPLRVAIFATHPIQYQVPLWRLLAGMSGFEVEVCYGTDMSVRGYKDREFGVSVAWDTPLTEGYPHRFLSTDPAIQEIGRWKPSACGAGKFIEEFKPDVALLTAYYPAFHAGAFMASRRKNIPIVMRHEASDVALLRSGWRARVRDQVLRRLYSSVANFAAIGTEARKHLLRLGVPSGRIGSSPYCVDSNFVESQITIWQPRRKELRARLGIKDGDVALVFSGKLIEKKNPLLIAEALRHLETTGNRSVVETLHVIVAGDGELRERVVQEFTSIIGPRFHALGFLNQREMGGAYGAGDCLVLPSRKGTGETWGLVVNEAMQYGLPAIVSDGVGCHVDMVDTNQTGWTFPSGDPAALADCILQLTRSSTEKMSTLRKNARRKAECVSLLSAVNGLAACLTRAYTERDA